MYFDSARIHALDADKIGALFLPGSGVALDPVKMNALCWWLWQLRKRNIRYILELHDARQIFPADLPPNASPLAQECAAQSFVGAPVGQMFPALAFDSVTLQPMQKALNQVILNFPNPYTGKTIGQDEALFCVQLTNENDLAKMDQWSEPSNCPVLQATFTAGATAFMQGLGKTLSQFGAVEHEEYWAGVQTAWAAAIAADVRTATHALVVTDCFFGDAPFSALSAGLAVGDVLDLHFYTGNSTSDWPGFQNGRTGQNPPDGRTRWAAACAGCTWRRNGVKVPLIASEIGPQVQHSPFPLDPARTLMLDSQFIAVDAALNDVDGLFLYSWFHAPVFSPGSIYQTSSTYDLRFVPAFVRGLLGARETFRDPSLRPAAGSFVSVTPAGIPYGAMVAGKFLNNGPTTAPELFAVPAGTPAFVSLPAA